MTLFCLGINHLTAPIEVRERFVCAQENIDSLLGDIKNLDFVSEVVLLSTCNRTEFYCVGDNFHGFVAWLAKSYQLSESELFDFFYAHQQGEVVAHLMQVACGLNSKIVGETQIFGQLKSSYAKALNQACVKKVLSKLFQQCFTTAKEVHTDTTISSEPVSVAYAGVKQAAKRANLTTSKVLVLGAGETAELVAKYLFAKGAKRLFFVNRTLANAERLAARYQGQALPLRNLTAELAEVDVIFSATAASNYLIKTQDVAAIFQQNPSKKLLAIDMALPRDIEPCIGDLPGVELFCIDDLNDLVINNIRHRGSAISVVNKIIERHTKQFMQWYESLPNIGKVCDYRCQAESVAQHVSRKAKKMLAAGHCPYEVVDYVASAMTGKLIHQPTVALRNLKDPAAIPTPVLDSLLASLQTK